MGMGTNIGSMLLRWLLDHSTSQGERVARKDSKEEEFPHFFDEKDAEASGSEEEELHEHGCTSNSESDGVVPDANI